MTAGPAPAQPTVGILTLGCKVNQSESDTLARQFLGAGYRVVSPDLQADVDVVNSCTVTHTADRKSRQLLSQTARRNEQALIVATGCFASIAARELRSPRTLVVRNRDKERLVPLVDARLGRTSPAVPSFVDFEKYGSGDSAPSRTRPMVKAQDGCDSHCAYCIIPRARGRSRSESPESVVARIQGLAVEGHVEVVLTGVDLGSYGEDDNGLPDLGGLIRRILDETEIPRLRVSSLEPGDFKEEWLELWETPRLCRHLHVPLQAGSATVLHRMARKYSPRDFARMVDLCREAIPRLTVTTDLIVGFPGETDAEFEEGRAFIETQRFDGMHVFKYSRRSGTRAASMSGHVAEDVKNERSKVLREMASAGVLRLVERHVGTAASVAWEDAASDTRRGLTDTNVRVYADPCPRRDGLIEKVQLIAPYGDGLWGEPTPDAVLPLRLVS